MRWLVILAAVTAVIGGAPALVEAQETSPPPAGRPAQPPPKTSIRDRLFYGGNVGLSFGDVDYVDVSPYLGMDFGHNVFGGVGVLYRYRDDSRYDPDLTTSDYGASLFVRYRLTPQLFLHGEYNWTNFEYPLLDGSTVRDDYGGVLLGGGFAHALGGRTAFIVSVLYDVTWSDDEPTPYDNPWVVSAGISVGF
jgi:hypothetical protein